jgi:multidrug resistance efflux pump
MPNLLPQPATLAAHYSLNDTAMPHLDWGAWTLVETSAGIRRLARWLLLALVGTVFVVAVAPWQQSVSGTGTVVAYSPQERQQTIDAPIEGRIVSWGHGVTENSLIQKGDLICEIQDLDAGLLGRLQDQLRSMERNVTAASDQYQANLRNLEAAKTIVTAYEAQVSAYRTVKEETIASAEALVEMSEEKVKSEEKRLEECQTELPQVEAQFQRQKTLLDEKIASVQKFQEAEYKYKSVRAKIEKTEFDVEASRFELESKRRDLKSKAQKSQADVEYANAMLRKANADVAKAEADVAKADSEVNKARKEFLEMQTKVAQRHSQRVTAPMSGFIVKLYPNQSSQWISAGEPLCVIVPDTTDRAVQIWVDGNDASLIEPGRHVRLQFEGWPAVQFAGWPSVAVGTFGGQIVSIDATDDGQGRFRTMIRPDSVDQPWPSPKFLRQGVRANGWVLLNKVPLWYEMWRRLNGFPVFGTDFNPEPSTENSAADSEKSAGKAGKSKSGKNGKKKSG